jgi:hypothetical protein
MTSRVQLTVVCVAPHSFFSHLRYPRCKFIPLNCFWSPYLHFSSSRRYGTERVGQRVRRSLTVFFRGRRRAVERTGKSTYTLLKPPNMSVRQCADSLCYSRHPFTDMQWPLTPNHFPAVRPNGEEEEEV